MPPIHVNLSKNASIPSVHGGALWADDVNYRLFLFGGEFYDSNPITSSMMSYDIWNDQWDDFGPPSEGIQRVSYGASNCVMERGEGYYYGGYLSNASVPDWTGDPQATSDLIRYQMDDQSWTKLAGPDKIRRAEGVMTFIPASDAGMLIYFGGVQDRDDNGTMVPQPMEQIFLYDIISNEWHIQQATGTIPEYRRRFCAGAVWSKDRSSYNIYLNAGLGFGGDGYDDVYILSLPSFQWIKTYPLDRNGTGEYPSHSLSCNVVNDGSQMLTIGGSFPENDDTCDYEQVWGVHNIDLGNQVKDNFQKTWSEYVPALFGYNVPQYVTKVIGGTKDGGATHTKPSDGFVDHDIGILLATKAEFPNRTRADDGRSDPAMAKAGKKSGSSLSHGAIIGIAVGGAIVLLAIIVCLWLFIRKHKRKSEPEFVPPTTPFVQTLPPPPDIRQTEQCVPPRSWDDSREGLNHSRNWRSTPETLAPSEVYHYGYRVAELGN
ncbi:hypothetical protein BGZ63DRAFT_474676 [Mariannaea sp. PMI_226]|nr:hypothetical protein BGZ63DRAFT_474676 [Mariannaea sp. PMI_226]